MAASQMEYLLQTIIKLLVAPSYNSVPVANALNMAREALRIQQGLEPDSPMPVAVDAASDKKVIDDVAGSTDLLHDPAVEGMKDGSGSPAANPTANPAGTTGTS